MTGLATLHPRLQDVDVLGELRGGWSMTRRLRIEDALAPGLADAIVEAASAHPFAFFERHVSDVRAVFWRQQQRFPRLAEVSGFAAMGELQRLVEVELPALASAITGQSLRSAAGDGVSIDYYTRGSYLDAHTDQGADRLVAYVIGLTHDEWPAEEGGHLEFLAPDEQTVVDRVAPGWGSIDLFCIYPLTRPHRIPLLRTNVTRLSINGWLTGELKGPGED